MKTGANCPACGGRLTFWSVFKAPTPFRLTCPRCKAKLKVVLPGLGALLAVVFSLFVLLGVLSLYGYRNYGLPIFSLGLVALAVLWVVVEVSAALLFFNRARFEVVAKKEAL